MIKNFGTQIESIWKDLRPMTKEMLVSVMQTDPNLPKQKFSYDAHVDWELSRLLNALDEQKIKPEKEETLSEINHLAKICADVLESQTKSAEIFIQLAKRALARNDYHKIDKLSDILLERFAVSEIAEIIKQTDLPQIRAISFETLAVMPVPIVTQLLKDPLYFEIGCNVLEQQAFEFGNEEARIALEQMTSGFITEI